MNKGRKDIKLRRRRHSLPPTACLSVVNPELPKGSDIFKRALEDMYANEPGHESLRTLGTGINGLTNIFEGNESDCIESEEEIELAFEEDDPFCERRHSSPGCLDKRIADITLEVPRIRKQSNTDTTTGISTGKFQKEYFIKHGRWPTPKAGVSHRRMSCPNTSFRQGKKTEKKNNTKVGKNRSNLKA